MIEPKNGALRPGTTAFVLLTVGVSRTIWTVAWFATGRPVTLAASSGMIAAIYAASFAPGVVAALLTARSSSAALWPWLRGVIRLRCGWRAYAAALVPLPLAVLVLTVALGYAPRISGLHGQAPALLYLTLFPVSLFNGLATALLGAGPLGEEGGWRGFLLPRLLERGGEAHAALIVGAVWTLWHLPIMAMFADWRSGVPFAAYLPLYALGVITLSCLMTRVWLLGRGSLVPCVWLHGLANAVGGMAFDHRLWISRWSAEASVFHFAVAVALAAALVRAESRTIAENRV